MICLLRPRFSLSYEALAYWSIMQQIHVNVSSRHVVLPYISLLCGASSTEATGFKSLLSITWRGLRLNHDTHTGRTTYIPTQPLKWRQERVDERGFNVVSRRFIAIYGSGCMICCTGAVNLMGCKQF